MHSLVSTVTALALGVGAAEAALGELNGYWGQNGYIYDRLSDYCDSGVKYATLSFIQQAPEHDVTNWPGMGFAAHCGGDYYYKNGTKSHMLSNCQTIKEDIPYCKSRGVKILLSIGGVYDPKVDADYKVTTEENGRYFADFLHGAFGPFDPTWDGPRPFDLNNSTHNSVDGYDFDVEEAFDNKPYIAMIEQLRLRDPNVFITAAPQCPLTDPYYYLKEMIQKTKLDAIFIQFYNNIGCDLIIGDSPGDYFNYDDWEATIAKSDKSKDAKLFIGLPADEGASGYVTPNQLRRIICIYAKRPHFGGVSLWDLTLATANKIKGISYLDSVVDILENGCPKPPPVTTTTTTTSDITSTTTDITSSTTDITSSTTDITSSTTDITSSTTDITSSTTETPTPTTADTTTTVVSSDETTVTSEATSTSDIPGTTTSVTTESTSTADETTTSTTSTEAVTSSHTSSTETATSSNITTSTSKSTKHSTKPTTIKSHGNPHATTFATSYTYHYPRN